MNFNSSNNLYGFPQPLTRVFPAPIMAQRAPQTTDFKYPIGQSWIDEVGEDAYVLVNVTGNTATWNVTATTPGNVDTLTGDSGGAVTPSAGNITLAGTANQITSIGSGSTITFSLIGPYTPATFTSHGVLVGAGTSSIAALTAGTNGQVLLGSTGANPAFGTLTTSTGVAFTTGAGSLAVNIAQGGYKINTVSGTSSALAAQNSYVLTNASATTLTLPATAAVGDMILISGGTANSAGWVIAQNSGQTIYKENTATTTGVSGTATSAAHANESILLMCVTANTDFVIMYSNGTVTLA